MVSNTWLRHFHRWPPDQMQQSHEVRDKCSQTADAYFELKIDSSKVISLMRSIYVFNAIFLKHRGHRWSREAMGGKGIYLDFQLHPLRIPCLFYSLPCCSINLYHSLLLNESAGKKKNYCFPSKQLSACSFSINPSEIPGGGITVNKYRQ